MNKIWSQDAYLQAWHFAAEAHQGQTIPGSSLPYIVHVSSVAMEVQAALALEPIAEPNLAVQCALLHDVIEDTDVDYQTVEAAFGSAVAAAVQALSKNPTLPDKPAQMADSLARIQQQPQAVWLVKLGDRITNLQKPPAYWQPEKIAYYRDEAILIYEALKEASPSLAARLWQKIEAYRAFL